MLLSAGWKFVARVAAMQVPVHLLAVAGFFLLLDHGIVEYSEAFHNLVGFWLTGPLPLFMLIPLGLAVPRSAIYERALEAARSGAPCPEAELDQARRQLLGQATYSAGMALFQWLLNVGAGIAILHWQNHETASRLVNAGLAGIGIFAPLVAIAIWIATERAVRPYWPILFPDARPSTLARHWQSLDNRLLIAFVLSGPTAAGLMAGICYLKGVDILTAGGDGYAQLQGMVGMMALALGGTFFVALIFKQIFAHDLLDGMGRLSDAIDRMSRGERGVRVPVYNTDELGRLTERFNDLAEQLDRHAAPLPLPSDPSDQPAEVLAILADHDA